MKIEKAIEILKEIAKYNNLKIGVNFEISERVFTHYSNNIKAIELILAHINPPKADKTSKNRS